MAFLMGLAQQTPRVDTSIQVDIFPGQPPREYVGAIHEQAFIPSALTTASPAGGTALLTVKITVESIF